MKNFFKMVLATMLGVILLQVLLLLLFIFVSIGMVASVSTNTPTSIKPNSVLQLKLETPIQERTADNPFKNLNSYQNQVPLSFKDLVDCINKAATDDNIKGISIETQYIGASLATLEELRNVLIAFKKSGKFIYCFADGYSQSAYYVLSVADKICINPQGTLDLHGLSFNTMFLKGLLDKLDIETQIVKVGTYKSAVEPFVLNKMSEANKKQTSDLINSIWNNIVNQISKSRNISTETINDDCNQLSFFANLELAKSKGYVDTLMYKDQYIQFLKDVLQLKENEKINYVQLSEYKNVENKKANLSKNKIGILYANGNIIEGQGDNNSIGYNIAEELRKLQKDSSIKAIVLRVNSGGGSALMSENIWREVVNCKSSKPVVVSMSDMAASGGYYISCASDFIVAEPNTITGSIGVFGMIPNFQKLMTNKIGITFDGVKTNSHSDFLSNRTRPMDEYELAVMQQSVNNVYSTFLQRVSNGRGIPTDFVDSVGQGRIWSGIDALTLNLVDTLGGLDVAIAKAAELANLKDYTTQDYPHIKTFFEDIMESLYIAHLQIIENKKQTELGVFYPYFCQMEEILNRSGIQAVVPYIYVIK